MWQRVQTLYLAVSAILTLVMLLSVKAVAYTSDGAVMEEYKYLTYAPFAILLIIILILEILSITTYKIRVFQYRTTILTALVTLGFQIWLGAEFFVNLHAAAEGGAKIIYRLNVVFPLVCVILDVLAARGILADQLLVESVSRLREDRRTKNKKGNH